jgi:hypothetical protein
VDIERAEQMEEQAHEILRDIRRAGKAASLLRKAAALRPIGDPMAVNDLGAAGQLSYYAGELRSAQMTFTNAVDAAIRIGDVMKAANLLIDLAHVSVELRDRAAALSSTERAHLLASSPHLNQDERSQLMRRLNPMTVMAFEGTE